MISSPSIAPKMTNEAYHSLKHLISKSGLDQVAKSPAHYKWFLENEKPDTAALRFGYAFHTFLLEPNEFDARVAIAPECDKRTKDGKAIWLEFAEHNTDKTIISAEDHSTMLAMARAIKAHPAASLILNSTGKTEASLFWTDKDTGASCRARPDWMRADHLLVDLKTTACAKPEDFMRSAFQYRYHVQAAFYCDAYEAVTGTPAQGFVFIAVEKEPPYGVTVFVADSEFMRKGREEYKRNLRAYADCQQADLWPCYPDTIVPLSLPKWAFSGEAFQ